MHHIFIFISRLYINITYVVISIQKGGGLSGHPLRESMSADCYQPGFWARFGFFIRSDCGIGKRYILSSHWRETFLRV